MTPIEQELKRLAELEKAAPPPPWSREMPATALNDEQYDAATNYIAELRNAAPGLIEALSIAVKALEAAASVRGDGSWAHVALSQISKALLKGGER